MDKNPVVPPLRFTNGGLRRDSEYTSVMNTSPSLTVSQFLTPVEPNQLEDESETQYSERQRIFRSEIRRGRFAFQTFADTLSLGLNLPQRLLLVDELKRLPQLILNWLKHSSVRKLASERFGIMESDAVWQLSEGEIALLLEQSVRTIERLANGAWKHSHLGRENSLVNREIVDPIPAEINWWRVLQLLLLHLERKVWLTEMSAALPYHAQCRLHDPWVLMVLLWCYQSRDRFEEWAKVGTLVPTLYTDCLFLRLLPGPKLNNGKPCLIAIGPITIDDTRVMEIGGRMEQPPQNERSLVRYFRLLVQGAAASLPGWGDEADLIPQAEELEDALSLRTPSSADELNQRIKTLVRSWELVQDLRLPQSWSEATHKWTPHRSGWEFLASRCLWIARHESLWKDHITPWRRFIGGRDRGGVYLTVGLSKERKLGLSVLLEEGLAKNIELEFGDADELETQFKHSMEEIDKARLARPEIERIEVLVNQILEHRQAQWSHLILAINNLLHRSHSRQLNLAQRTNNDHEDLSETLLQGFDSRLCRYLLSMTQGHICTIYWRDYTFTPPRLIPIAAHSKNLRLRSEMSKIHSEFEANCDTGNYWGGENPRSLIYRVAHHNNAEVLRDIGLNDQVSAVVVGYPSGFEPRSALALPIRHNGRVLGVIEIKGFAARQFDEPLLVPLRRAASLIGAYVYDNLFLHQLWRLNNWLEAQPDSLRDHPGENRLQEVSRLLCNIFLCPLVHVWIRTPIPWRYDLVGYNREDIFADRPTDFKSTIFQIPGDDSVLPAYRPFAELAIKQWELNEEAWGKFVAARYDRNAEETQYSKDAQGKIDWEETLRTAETTGVVLGRDWVANADAKSSYYRKNFVASGYTAIMSFGLAYKERQLSKKQFSKKLKPPATILLGVLTLHDYGGSGVYSTGWAPVVAYIQAYLVHILLQLEVLHEPTRRGKSILLHDAGALVDMHADTVKKFSQQWHDLTGDKGGAFLEYWVRNLPRDEKDRVEWVPARADLVRLGKALRRIQNTVDALGRSVSAITDRRETLSLVAARIKNRRYFGNLDIGPGEKIINIDVAQRIRIAAASNRISLLEEKHCLLEARGLGEPLTIAVVKSLWERIENGLFENIGKYIREHSVCQIEYVRGKLIWRNEGRYDPALPADAFGVLGVRGEYALSVSGEGYGLWVIKQACALSAIDFKYEIHPQKNTPYAEHRISLGLSDVMVSGERGLR